MLAGKVGQVQQQEIARICYSVCTSHTQLHLPRPILISACSLCLFPISNLFILYFTKIWIDKGLENVKIATVGSLGTERTVPWGKTTVW